MALIDGGCEGRPIFQSARLRNQDEIARLFGVSQQAVSLWLGDDSIPITNDCNRYNPDSRVKIPSEEHAIIFERIATGDVQAQIAADYGVSQKTISKILTKETKRRNREALIQGWVLLNFLTLYARGDGRNDVNFS